MADETTSEGKVCPKCETFKPLSQFHNNRRREDKKSFYCGLCMNAYIAAAKAGNPTRTWASNAVANSRKRAKEAGLAFLVSAKLIFDIAPTHCPVFGVPLSYEAKGGMGPRPNSPTIDRIDNSLGYTPDNVVIMSHRANSLKGSASLEEMKQLADFYNRVWQQYGNTHDNPHS